jgi:hypothetical protein
MNIIIEQFKKHAEQLGREKNSINELKLWFTAIKNVEFDKIFQENNQFKSEGAYDIIKVLREKYGFNNEDIETFIQDYIVKPDKVIDATYELDRTEGRPGASCEEFREDLVGLGG